MKSVVKLDNLSKSFGESTVLSDISLEVNPGEVVSIIGPSGSGKSTLLRCLTLLEHMDQGSLSYGDDIVCTQTSRGSSYISEAALRKVSRKFGLVFQDFNLFPHWKVSKNIADPLVSIEGVERQEAYRRTQKLLEKMGLSDKAEAYPGELSGGQKQRVAIARALAPNPMVIYFDEPTSALDPELTQEILKVMRTLAKEHMTMVIVTHEIDFARSVSDRVIFMADGHIVEEGTPENVLDNPQNPRTQVFLQKLHGEQDDRLSIS